MNFVLLIITIVTSIVAITNWIRQKQFQDVYAYQEVRAENWALPSHNMDAFKPLLVDATQVANEKDATNIFESTPAVMTYESEKIDDEIENFYLTLMEQATTEPVQSESYSNEYEHVPSFMDFVEPTVIDEHQNPPQDVVECDKEEVAYGSSNVHVLSQEPVSDEAFYYAVRGQLDEAAATLQPKPFAQYEPTLLTTADWENTEADYTVTIDPSFMDLADCRIADGQLGLQSWVVMIVGKEQEYLHVADGTARTWINAESFMDKQFNNGDILFIELERREDGLSVETLNILERSSDDTNKYGVNADVENYQEYDSYHYEELEIYVS